MLELLFSKYEATVQTSKNTEKQTHHVDLCFEKNERGVSIGISKLLLVIIVVNTQAIPTAFLHFR